MEVGEFIWVGGDIHLYSNHIEQVKLQLTRKPYYLCKVELNKNIDNIFDFKLDDIKVIDYIHHKAIKAPNQIDRIIGFDCIDEDFDNILKELYNYNVFISFTEALQSLKLATPDLLSYISHLPKSHTRTHHGFICCELIKTLNK